MDGKPTIRHQPGKVRFNYLRPGTAALAKYRSIWNWEIMENDCSPCGSDIESTSGAREARNKIRKSLIWPHLVILRKALVGNQVEIQGRSKLRRLCFPI